MFMPKTFVICLDGARYDVVKKWAEEGYLPTFKKILNEGSHGPLKSVLPGPHTAIAWMSMLTSKQPGKHGYIYTFMPIGNNKFKLFNSTSIDAPKIWDIYSQNNLAVGIMDVPLTYPPIKVNGFMVCSTMTPAFAKDYTYPKELDVFMNDYMGCSCIDCYGVGAKALNNLYTHTDLRLEAQDKLLERYNVDLFLKHISGTEQLNYIYPSFFDKNFSDYSETSAEIVRDYYQHLDNYFGRLMNRYPDANYIFFSDHGSYPMKRKLYLNDVLKELGFFSPSKVIKNNSLINRCFKYGAKIYLKFPYNFQKFIKRFVPNSLGTKIYTPITIDADWNNTIAYSFVWGMIFVNKSHPNYSPEFHDKIVNNIYDKLISHPQIKESVYKIYKKSEIFEDSHFDYLPDLYVRVQSDVKAMYGLSNGKLIEYVNEHNRKTLDGIFFAIGPNIKHGYYIYPSILDLVPTILHMNKLKVPSDMDGKVLKEIFDEESSLFKSKIIYDYTNSEKQKLNKLLNEIVF